MSRLKGIVAIFTLVLPLFGGINICNADGFDSVRCGSDVRKALVGRKMLNEKIVAIEERHKDLGLKDLGASEISDRLSVISWRICGEEYVLLEDKDVVRDVLKFPKHSKESPAFIGSCQLNGHDVPGTAIGVLKNENGVQILPAVSAWKIDDKQMKFVELKTEGIRCSRDGIITADGGLLNVFLFAATIVRQRSLRTKAPRSSWCICPQGMPIPALPPPLL